METDIQTPPEIDPAPEPTLAEHEAQYSNQPRLKQAAPVAEDAGGAEEGTETASESPAAGERDAAGRFKTGRHRAKSQQAGPEDVPRIAELTRKLRETEARLADIEARTSRPAEQPRTEQPRRQPAPQQAIELPADFPPEPNPADFPDDVLKYTAAHARWAAKAEIALDNITRARHETEARRVQGFSSRIDKAKEKYTDFEAIALGSPTRIQPGSVVDAFVMEHPAGADLLYHLQKNGTELDRVLALSPVEQAYELSLLAQRLTAPPTRTQAASTGSAAAPLVPTVAKPPNPVRTGPMKSGDEPPSDEGSVTEHERYWFKGRRR